MAENESITVYEWECDARPRRERGRTWHIVAPIVGVGLLIIAVLSDNFLFAFLIILFSVMFYMRTLGHPPRVVCSVSPAGLVVGSSEFRLKDLRKFWFAYEPPHVKSLYVEVEGLVRSRLAIELDDADPNVIREILSPYVPEDHAKDGEPISEVIGRLLKL